MSSVVSQDMFFKIPISNTKQQDQPRPNRFIISKFGCTSLDFGSETLTARAIRSKFSWRWLKLGFYISKCRTRKLTELTEPQVEYKRFPAMTLKKNGYIYVYGMSKTVIPEPQAERLGLGK